MSEAPSGERSPDEVGPQRQYYVPAPADAPEPPPTPQPRRSKPGSPPPGPPAPPGRPKGPKKPRRFRRARWLLVLPALLIVLGAYLGLRARSAYNRIERVDLSQVLDPVSGESVNYLLVGSDSRAELDPEGNSGVTGSRSDTIIVLRMTPNGSSMMSIPRDLWVEIADSAKMGRINGSYNHGPADLVRTVKNNLDIPINHYMEVGFGSFASLVDAVGGVTIDFPHPAFDSHSGLNVATAGPVRLDGRQALAYARSRHYTEIIDGRKVADPTADLGRQQRQQLFLRSALAEVGATRNPLTLIEVADAMSSELKVDSGLGLGEAVSFVRKLSGSDPQSVILPVKGTRKGRAAVVVLDQPEAKSVLSGFR